MAEQDEEFIEYDLSSEDLEQIAGGLLQDVRYYIVVNDSGKSPRFPTREKAEAFLKRVGGQAVIAVK